MEKAVTLLLWRWKRVDPAVLHLTSPRPGVSSELINDVFGRSSEFNRVCIRLMLYAYVSPQLQTPPLPYPATYYALFSAVKGSIFWSNDLLPSWVQP